MNILLRGGSVVSGRGAARLDVLLKGETVAAVGVELPAGDAQVVDCAGRLLFPGFIDAHTHFDLAVAGTVTADGFETGTRAAVAGGTTMVIDFATQYKGESLHQALENWHRKADGVSFCDYGFHLAVSDWNRQASQELGSVIEEGVSSFKLYMTYDDMILDDEALYQVLKRLRQLGGIAGVHCENSGLIKALTQEEKARGNLGPSAHKRSRPAAVEAEAVSRLLKIAALAEAPVIVVHLSSQAGYREVEAARERGQEVYVETCPQYLLLDESLYDLPGFQGAKYVIAPPLRSERDRACLWSALGRGLIQTVSTDHCSFTLAQKGLGREDFTRIPGGMAGVETRPVLIYTYGVEKGLLTVEQMCRVLSENPAKLYGVYPRKGCVQAGSDADLVIWNPETSWTLTGENQAANVDYQAYEGFPVKGMAEKVYLRGRLAARDGQVEKTCGGEYIARGLCQKV